MKIISLVGSRSNPKGQEWLLGGHNLIEWPYTASCLSKLIGKENTYISTDSTVLYEKLIKQVGNDNWITRPGGLATDKSTDCDWISHALTTLKIMGVKPDLIVLLRQTSPLIDYWTIDLAIELFNEHPEATSLRSAHPLPETPAKMFCKDGAYWHPYITPVGFGLKEAIDLTNRPRQMFPTCYAPNGYVDILRPSVIETGVLYGDKILAFETTRITEIDDEQALQECELHYENSPLWNKKFDKFAIRRPDES